MHILVNYKIVRPKSNGFYIIYNDGYYILHVSIQTMRTKDYHLINHKKYIGFMELYIKNCLTYRIYPNLPTLDTVIERLQPRDLYSMILQLSPFVRKMSSMNVNRQNIVIIRVAIDKIDKIPTFGKCYKLLDYFPISSTADNYHRLLLNLIKQLTVEFIDFQKYTTDKQANVIANLLINNSTTYVDNMVLFRMFCQSYKKTRKMLTKIIHQELHR